MSLSSSVRKARDVWRSTPLPVQTFRAHDARSITYGIECDLDHHASHVVSRIEELERRNPHWDFQARAGSDLKELRELRERVEALELDETMAAPLYLLIGVTKE